MFFQLFWTFMKIGTFTLGGGYAMLPLIQREVVDSRHWIDGEEFMNMIALAQAAPGIIAVNSAIFIGWRIGGWRGVCGAVLGAVLPSFLIILAIAMVFSEWKELPAVEAAFKGIRPAVVALIAAPLVKMAKTAMKSKVESEKSKVESQKSKVESRKSKVESRKAKGESEKSKASFWPLLVSLAAALLIWLGGVNPVWVIAATIVFTIAAQWINDSRNK